MAGCIRRNPCLTFVILCLLVLTVGASRASGDTGWTWPRTDPTKAGFDPAALERIHRDAESGRFANVHAILVDRGGHLVFERYYTGDDQSWGQWLGEITFDADTLHDLRSVTKSVTTLLLGIALGDGFEAALDRPILDFFPDHPARNGSGLANAKLRHVLTMTAGIAWNEMDVPYHKSENDERQMYYTPDPIGLVLARPSVSPPGERWYYNGGLTQLLTGVIRRETGQRIDHFAEEKLFKPLGITEYEWLRSGAWPDELSPSAASGLRLKPRDLAKIAAVAARGGVWQGQRIVSEAWLRRSFERSVKTIRWSPNGVYGYGFMWYPGKTLGKHGVQVVRAVGWGDQRLFLVPDLDLVVIVHAGNYRTFRHRSGDVIFSRVLEALIERD